jgi:hypothetical protein
MKIKQLFETTDEDGVKNLLGMKIQGHIVTVDTPTDVWPDTNFIVKKQDGIINTFRYAPASVQMDVICTDNKLHTLIGFPKNVGGDIELNENGLVDLQGMTLEKVNGHFAINHNPELVSLKGCPKIIASFFDASYCSSLRSLKHGPEEAAEFHVSNCSLTSLEGCAKKIHGMFDCSNNKLRNLIGGPTEVKGKSVYASYYDCSDNLLTSFEGAPETIHGSFLCRRQ